MNTTNTQTTGTLFTSLLGAEISPEQENDHFLLSLYVPNDSSKLQVSQVIKSHISRAFKSQESTKDFMRVADAITEVFEKHVHDTPELLEGMAFFTPFQLTTDRPEDIREKIVSEMIFIKLHSAPQPNATIGTIYNLDQLAFITQRQFYAHVLHVTRNEADVYQYDTQSFEKIFTIENPYLVDKEKEHLEFYGPSQGKRVVHGTGSNKLSKREDKENEQFLKRVIESFEKKVPVTDQHELLFVYYSENFEDHIKDAVDALDKKRKNLHCILIDKNHPTASELKKATTQELKNHRNKATDTVLNALKNNRSTFAVGWNDVTKASRHGMIEALIIKVGAEQEGYLLEDYLYSYPIMGSSKVDSLYRHLVRATIQSGGEIYLIDKGLQKKNPLHDIEVAALIPSHADFLNITDSD